MYTGVIHNVFVVTHNVRVCIYRDLLGGHVMVIHNVFVCTQGLAGRSCDGLLLQASGSGFELVQR